MSAAAYRARRFEVFEIPNSVMPSRNSTKLEVSTPPMASTAPATAMPYPSARPGRRPKRPIRRDSGQLARAAPSAPTATGTPTHRLVPVMLAAMMPPTAMPME